MAEVEPKSREHQDRALRRRREEHLKYALGVGFDLLAGEVRGPLGREAEFVRLDDMPGHNRSAVEPIPSTTYTCSF